MVHAAVRGSHHARVRICSEPFGASLLAGISWGGMASTMFVPLFAGLFWPGATRAGALASAIGGFAFAVIGFVLKRAGIIPFHEIYPGLVASLLLMVLVSSFTAAENTSLKQRL